MDSGLSMALRRLELFYVWVVLLPFQITGFILLIAVVGVVVLNQRGRKN